MARLSMRSIAKSFGTQSLFRDFNLDVADGEFLCLLGPSGSGKTTLIRLVAGLEPLHGGEIWIGKREVSGLAPRDRHIGMTFQGYALYPHMSVRQNLRYPLEVRGVRRTETEPRVAEVARMLGISPLLDRRVGQISGGEQQRVAIGRAVVQQPDLYLLDEPISNLDASLRETVRGELRRLQQKLQATMVMVTHDQFDALAVADRIAVLREGVLQQIGAPEELYDRPANLFVAGFIGRLRMNFLPCEAAADGAPVLRGDGFAVAAPPGSPAGSALTIGLRPESIDLLPPGATSAMPATVQGWQFQGEHAVCTARVGEVLVQVALPAAQRPEPGATIWLQPRPGQMHVFDRPSGKRIDLRRATQSSLTA